MGGWVTWSTTAPVSSHLGSSALLTPHHPPQSPVSSTTKRTSLKPASSVKKAKTPATKVRGGELVDDGG